MKYGVTKLGSDYINARRPIKEETRENSMASVNKVILVGNLGKDLELKYTQAGKAFCNFSIATSEQWSDANGTRQEKTEWHRITVWAKQAENCAKYLKKGSSAYVEGRLQTRVYEDKDGTKKYSTEIVADNVKFLGSGSGQRQQPAADQPAASQYAAQYDYQSSETLDDVPF